MRIVAKIANDFHGFVGDRIGPTFDRIERACDRHPGLTLPVNLGLIAALPAWCVLGSVVNRLRRS